MTARRRFCVWRGSERWLVDAERARMRFSPAWPPEGGHAGEGDAVERVLMPSAEPARWVAAAHAGRDTRRSCAVQRRHDAEVGGHDSGHGVGRQQCKSGHWASAIRVPLSLAKRPLRRCSLKRPIRHFSSREHRFARWQCSARRGGLLRRAGLAPAPGHGCDRRLCPGLCNRSGRALSCLGAGLVRCYRGL